MQGSAVYTDIHPVAIDLVPAADHREQNEVNVHRVHHLENAKRGAH